MALYKLCLYIIIILQGVQSIIIRSSLARELPPHELGTVFAVNEILVSLLPLATAPLASAVYNATSCQQCLQVTILYQIYIIKLGILHLHLLIWSSDHYPFYQLLVLKSPKRWLCYKATKA